MYEYYIINRQHLVDELISWISEARGNNKELIRKDLTLLMSISDDYIFSSISTNEYLSKDDINFDKVCKGLITLSKSLE